MTDKDQVLKFIDLIAKSGLPQARQKFWIQMLKDDGFTAEQEQIFIRELEEHRKDIAVAMKATEEDIEELNVELDELEEESLPYLKLVADKQDEFQEKELAEYKVDIMTGEKKMMDKIENIRVSGEEAEIEKLRKKLGS